MMTLVRIVAGLHLLVYAGIMWYGWQSYRLLRKKSWRYMGIGFTIFLVYRVREFVHQLWADYPIDTIDTLVPFAASLFLLVAFWMLHAEHHDLLTKLAGSPSPLRSGAQPVEFWLEKMRLMMREEVVAVRGIVRDEIAAASGTTTVTVKGPSATTPEVAVALEEAPK